MAGRRSKGGTIQLTTTISAAATLVFQDENLFSLVLKYLSPKDLLLVISLVNRTWRRISLYEPLWAYLLKHEIAALPPHLVSW